MNLLLSDYDTPKVTLRHIGLIGLTHKHVEMGVRMCVGLMSYTEIRRKLYDAPCRVCPSSASYNPETPKLPVSDSPLYILVLVLC